MTTRLCQYSYTLFPPSDFLPFPHVNGSFPSSGRDIDYHSTEPRGNFLGPGSTFLRENVRSGGDAYSVQTAKRFTFPEHLRSSVTDEAFEHTTLQYADHQLPTAWLGMKMVASDCRVSASLLTTCCTPSLAKASYSTSSLESTEPVSNDWRHPICLPCSWAPLQMTIKFHPCLPKRQHPFLSLCNR